MKRYINFLCAAGFGFFSTLAVADLPPAVEAPELIALRDAYRSQVAAAAEAVQIRYKAKLQEMIKLQTQKGDIDAAIATRNELKSLDTTSGPTSGTGAPSAASPVAEIKASPLFTQILRWQEVNGSATMEFNPNGQWSEKWNGQVKRGRWKAITADTVQVENIDGRKIDWIYQLQSDGETCRRCHDNVRFRKALSGASAESAKPGTPTPASGPASGDHNPFGRISK